MKRRAVLQASVGASLLVPLHVLSQAMRKVHRIGLLAGNNPATDPAIARFHKGLLQRLRELGYAEGRNLLVEHRNAEGRSERFPKLAAELVALKVELIVAGTDLAALAARKHTDSIPIVFVAAGDPVGIGLVKSLARPGGNVTGFASFTDVVISKQLELLAEIVPDLKRVGVIYSTRTGAWNMQLSALRASAATRKLILGLHELKTDLEATLQEASRDRVDSLLVLPSIDTFLHRKRIAEFAAGRRLPAVYGLGEYVESGGLMSYAFNYADNFRRAADYVDKILKGARPADLPVQLPDKFELVINLRAANALGLNVPRQVLLRADRVID